MEEQNRSLSMNGLKRTLLCRDHLNLHKKTWFKYPLLLCVTLLVCYIRKEKSLLHQHYQRLVNEPNQVKAPSYRVHPKQRDKLDSKIPRTTFVNLTAGAQYHQAYPKNYHFIIDVGDVCESSTPFLVLMVPVEPNNVAARNAIRSTWGKKTVVQGKKVLTLFMLGLAEGPDLWQESELHGDLIQSDFRDTYLNLTIKTMVIMEWLATRCPTATYGMKIDSDMFLNVDNLVLMLQKPSIPQNNYLTGWLMRNKQVIRSKSSKWYVSEEIYPDLEYPLYTLGMGYVFSGDLPCKLVEISRSIKPFNIEDAYVGMCMKKLGIAITSPPDPSQFRTQSNKFDRCTYSKIITSILASPEQLLSFWMKLKMPGLTC
ncbi:beta-1,3-galactosyltransferase 2-like [Syngnathus acus]|uniref:beta-1,3-galactosyltransferase 2-like n=1 Tax=Syngnathus acus TaxID=161584 RepID=UPI001885C061|nr:beta-1,3-galactosyltransferase 2-like [Syngnathus acus]